MGTPVDFDLAVLILKVLEGWELGNRGLYRKYRAYKKSLKFQNILVPGVRKTDFYDFSGFSRTFPGFFLGLKNRFFTNLFYDEKSIFYEKMGRKSGNLE